ncbi:hypothetical protein DFH09DRAFT_1089942 [Mycena vulgaris]|nr:hypothetical protein DFH09DRAFT_1089937 [Mycena vulgaris]KAJ6540193.1 hypothetical protein DFH09DRAFT_1089942 [Mycena vulgaris]
MAQVAYSTVGMPSSRDAPVTLFRATDLNLHLAAAPRYRSRLVRPIFGIYAGSARPSGHAFILPAKSSFILVIALIKTTNYLSPRIFPPSKSNLNSRDIYGHLFFVHFAHEKLGSRRERTEDIEWKQDQSDGQKVSQYAHELESTGASLREEPRGFMTQLPRAELSLPSPVVTRPFLVDNEDPNSNGTVQSAPKEAASCPLSGGSISIEFLKSVITHMHGNGGLSSGLNP